MAKQKCNNCGTRIIKNPIWKGQEFNEPFSMNKIIWKNMFKIELLPLVFTVIVIFMAWSYVNDIQEYKQIFEEPCEFVKVNQEACYQIELQKLNPVLNKGVIIDPIS